MGKAIAGSGKMFLKGLTESGRYIGIAAGMAAAALATGGVVKGAEWAYGKATEKKPEAEVVTDKS